MTTEEFINHDCKLSPESGCDTCEKFACEECEDTGEVKFDLGGGDVEIKKCIESVHEVDETPEHD